jgi:hypothetical protein
VGGGGGGGESELREGAYDGGTKCEGRCKVYRMREKVYPMRRGEEREIWTE